MNKINYNVSKGQLGLRNGQYCVFMENLFKAMQCHISEVQGHYNIIASIVFITHIILSEL